MNVKATTYDNSFFLMTSSVLIFLYYLLPSLLLRIYLRILRGRLSDAVKYGRTLFVAKIIILLYCEKKSIKMWNFCKNCQTVHCAARFKISLWQYNSRKNGKFQRFLPNKQLGQKRGNPLAPWFERSGHKIRPLPLALQVPLPDEGEGEKHFFSLRCKALNPSFKF